MSSPFGLTLQIPNPLSLAQSYQPETVCSLVDRVIAGKDLATGRRSTVSGGGHTYSSRGPLSSFHIKNKLPKIPRWECNLWSAISSCTQEQYDALADGTAVIDNYKIVQPAGGSPGTITKIL